MNAGAVLAPVGDPVNQPVTSQITCPTADEKQATPRLLILVIAWLAIVCPDPVTFRLETSYRGVCAAYSV